MRQAPTWAAGVIMAVMFAAGWFGVTSITIPELTIGVRVVVSVATGAAFGLVMGVILGRQRRQYGQAANRPDFARAVRRGTIPPDVNTGQWRQALLRRQKEYRTLRRTAPLLYLPMTGLSIWLAVAGQPLFWFAAAFFVGVLTLTVAVTPRTLRNTDAMLTELDHRENAQHIGQ
ncbi:MULTISPECIES: NarK/NasA family nitrate transporter [unclassified Curtobacterium]|uniref:NarK/NasA family nitrate transporter n=1 Tax=unclassified Curtobacterium TaxID=257496 RepID=UPI0011B3F555|nr:MULTISPECIES: NarK/NasA family nitrate transporter [unclassified Curtobacterium]